jgi:hypothetical protein
MSVVYKKKAYVSTGIRLKRVRRRRDGIAAPHLAVCATIRLLSMQNRTYPRHISGTAGTVLRIAPCEYEHIQTELCTFRMFLLGAKNLKIKRFEN